MMYSLKNLAYILEPARGLSFICQGLTEIYNLIHSIPNYNYEPYVQLNTAITSFRNLSIYDDEGVMLKDNILQCRNNLKSMLQHRLKFTDKTNTTNINTQTSEYNGNEAYNSAKNTAKGTNQTSTTHYSNTDYQDNEYLKEDVTKYIKQFTRFLGDYINTYIIGRKVYNL